ncbi:enolase C-terminal domain-like protein [Marinovum algicola]|uniref:enolase C-terminal domain-like protein n=1 Tax=Marinovum algicola TaxID=42444 RepID=UPI0024B8DB9B|nr:enolase C-terminal domain-like protein [Marinovum algicola]
MTQATIAAVQVTAFRYPIQNCATERTSGHTFDCTGATSSRARLHVTVRATDGSCGTYVGGTDVMLPQVEKAAQLLIGMPWHAREPFYATARRLLQKHDRMGVGLLDSALWDLAGKRAGMSVAEMLGGARATLPAYASTWMGGPGGGLQVPQDYVDFALECRELGYRGFKMHGWGVDDVDREIATVLALGKAIGHSMALMSDPMCSINGFGDTLRLAKACDAAGFYWLEDPMSDGGQAATAYRAIREKCATPLMIGECVRGLEANASVVLAGASDFVRADPDFDMGITGTMKLAHFAEAIGLDVELHAPGPAQRACMAALRNSKFYEVSMVGPGRGLFAGGYYACGYSDALDDVSADGTVPVPAGAGLGVQYDMDFIRGYAFADLKVAA